MCWWVGVALDHVGQPAVTTGTALWLASYRNGVGERAVHRSAREEQAAGGVQMRLLPPRLHRTQADDTGPVLLQPPSQSD